MTRRRTDAALSIGTRSVVSADGTTISVVSVGQGPSVIVVGGAMRTAEDYLAFAAGLARDRQVHILERRGRGASGPLGASYAIARECEDLIAVQAVTGATDAFGHSYGGLVALETARRHSVFERVVVYEPAVSIEGSIPTGWIGRYRELLDAGRPRAAFAYFIQQSGHAPAAARRLPLWYLTAVMRVVVRQRQWQRFRPLLATNIAEHEQVDACDIDIGRYASIQSSVLLLGGSRSPAFASLDLLSRLTEIIPTSDVEIVSGLDHNAPDEKNPDVVARHVSRFLSST